MWKFRRVRLKPWNDRIEGEFPQEWVLCLSTEQEVLGYWMATSNQEAAEAYKDHKRYSEADVPFDHYKNTTAAACGFLGNIMQGGFMAALTNMLTGKLDGMLNQIKAGRAVYVKEAGGYSYDTVDGGLMYEVLEEREFDRLVWPEHKQEIKIKQWPRGRHWYAKVGNVEVVVDGKNKWNTYEGAKAAADEFVKKCDTIKKKRKKNEHSKKAKSI